jgi:hypothetical protein
VQRLQREYEAATNPEVKLAKAGQMFDAIHELVPHDVWPAGHLRLELGNCRPQLGVYFCTCCWWLFFMKAAQFL